MAQCSLEYSDVAPPGSRLALDLHTEMPVGVGDLVLAVVADQAGLVGPGAPGQAAQEAQENSLEFVAKNAINDEVD